MPLFQDGYWATKSCTLEYYNYEANADKVWVINSFRVHLAPQGGLGGVDAQLLPNVQDVVGLTYISCLYRGGGLEFCRSMAFVLFSFSACSSLTQCTRCLATRKNPSLPGLLEPLTGDVPPYTNSP